jgi:hypothetical protein
MPDITTIIETIDSMAEHLVVEVVIEQIENIQSLEVVQ